MPHSFKVKAEREHKVRLCVVRPVCTMRAHTHADIHKTIPSLPPLPPGTTTTLTQHHRHTTHTQYTLQLPDTTPKCPGLRSRPAAGPHWRLRGRISPLPLQSEITRHRQRGQGYSAQGRGRHLKGLAPALPSGCIGVDGVNKSKDNQMEVAVGRTSQNDRYVCETW